MIALKKCTVAVFGVNFVLMTLTAFIFIFKVPKESNYYRDDGRRMIDVINHIDSRTIDYNYWGPLDNVHVKSLSNKQLSNEPLDFIEIWSKAAMGIYLWEHILTGELSKKSPFYQYGFRKVDRFIVKFRSGPSITPQSLVNYLFFAARPKDSKNMIFVLNGQSKDKMEFVKQWLAKIQNLSSRKDSQTSVNSPAILNGQEFGLSDWIKKYLKSNDVAIYRNFPDLNKLISSAERSYTCDFDGTVSNSSRVELMNVLKTFDKGVCIAKSSPEWKLNENNEAIEFYLQALRLSNLTPAGINYELHRDAQALSHGSSPMVKQNSNQLKDQKSNYDPYSAYRLSKKINAPVIYISNWTHEERKK